MIFYFSGTGNTRWAAEQLAQATGERLLSMAEELRSGNGCYELSEGERIGFCFAVHGWQPPHIVRQFIRQLRISGAEGHFCYALVTCGDSIGCTIEMLGSELAAVGLRVESAFSLVMPESYVCLPFMKTDTPEREQQKIAQAREDLARYAQLIVERRAGEMHLVKGPAPWVLSHVIGAYFNGRMISDKKFRVDDHGRSNNHALTLPSGELMGVFSVGDLGLGQANLLHNLQRHCVALCRGFARMDFQ
jgi:hypothetical protein